MNYDTKVMFDRRDEENWSEENIKDKDDCINYLRYLVRDRELKI